MSDQWADKTVGGHRILIRLPCDHAPWAWRGVVQDSHGTLMCWWDSDGKRSPDLTHREYDLVLRGSTGDEVQPEAIQAFSGAVGAYTRARNAVAAAYQSELEAEKSLREVLATIDGGAVIATDPAGEYWLYRIDGENVEFEQIQFS